MDVYFYEAFEEEASSLKSLLGNQLTYEMTDKTIQETDHVNPPARLISIRTQSIIPVEWADKLDGILSRSTGYDHLKKYLGDNPQTTAMWLSGRIRHARRRRACYSAHDVTHASIAATDNTI